MSVKIITGDCRDVLRTLPADSVHCCVTSPPYFGLRDYGVDGQMGLEETPEAFIAGMVAVFDEVRRVLRNDGTLWLNIGDSYAGSWGAQGHGPSNTSAMARHAVNNHPKRANKIRAAGVKPKDLYGIPWMLAFALRASGWYLRQDIIWSKPNPMPESVRDRCTKAHEYLFLLSKSERYYFDHEAIKEPASSAAEYIYAGDANGLHGGGESHAGSGKSTRRYAKGIGGWAAGSSDHSALGHNQSGRETHGAKVKNGKGDRATFRGGGKYTGGAAFDNSTDKPNDSVGNKERDSIMRNKRSVWTVATSPFKEAHFATFPPDLIVPCIQAGCPIDGTVLDPFGGAGTTGLVADRLQRHAVLIELNPKYADMARARISSDAPLLAEIE